MCPQKSSTAIWNRELAKSQKSLHNQTKIYVKKFDHFGFFSQSTLSHCKKVMETFTSLKWKTKPKENLIIALC